MTRDLKIYMLKFLELELFVQATILIYPSDQTELEKTILAWHFLHPSVRLISVGRSGGNFSEKYHKQKGRTSITLIYKNENLNLDIGFEDNLPYKMQ